ncbi:MAG: hypothetical protein PHU75_07575, partial [Candidatus Nanopelagicales bacterium]|nr:hypothetical protein [Candidatus Nanopelagicales bacterium]
GERVLLARAEDGALVSIAFDGDAAALADYWPPMGLDRIEVQGSAPVPALSLAAEAGSRDSLIRLESELGLFAAEHLASAVAVHAAIIKADGRVIVLPGESMSGKSTLCFAAHAAGHTVLSDEYVLVDPVTGLVRGWPRSLRLRVDGQWVRLGIAQEHEPLAVDLVAAITYDHRAPSGAGLVGVEPMSAGEVAMLLIANTVCAQPRPEDTLRAASALARTTDGIAAQRGEAELALAELVQRASAP